MTQWEIWCQREVFCRYSCDFVSKMGDPRSASAVQHKVLQRCKHPSVQYDSLAHMWLLSIWQETESIIIIIIIKHIYLPQRERKGEREKINVRETSIGCLPHVPGQGLKLQPRCAPWLRIKPVTLGLRDDAPTNWAIPPRAETES